jgi:hydroxyethylthiazole kinase-like uncharacterized protein yjeF
MALIQRDPDSHKGSHGAVGVLGGSPGTVGAAILCARSALMSGAGKVFIIRPDHDEHFIVDPLYPEIMVLDVVQSESRPIHVWVAGPGLGTDAKTLPVLSKIYSMPAALVIDADALNLMAEEPSLVRACQRRASHRQSTIVTPHPGEAAHLLGTTPEAIQGDRSHAAREIARRLNAICVLKGRQTLIANPAGDIVTNSTGNPLLATAGTGDVLAGLIGALLAQGLGPQQSAIDAVRLHGLAADTLRDEWGGEIGLAAGELIPVIRSLINRETPGLKS